MFIWNPYFDNYVLVQNFILFIFWSLSLREEESLKNGERERRLLVDHFLATKKDNLHINEFDLMREVLKKWIIVIKEFVT